MVTNLASTSLTAYSIAAEIAPAEWIKGSNLRGAWGESITIGIPSNVAVNPRVDLTINAVKTDQCKSILLEFSKFFKSDAGTGRSSQILTGAYMHSISDYATLPATVETIDSICTVDQNISFVIKIDR